MRIFIAILPYLLSVFNAFCQDTVTVMYYNILWYPRHQEDREELYRKIIDDIDPDILVVSEMMEKGLKAFYCKVICELDDINYNQSQWHSEDQSDIHLYFNAEKFYLDAQHYISASTRDINEYQLIYKHMENIKLYVLGAHLKASNSRDDRTERLQQCKAYRDHMNEHHSDDMYALFGGDFNFYKDREDGFQHLIAEGDDQLFDPIKQPGNWHDNAQFALTHTQSTRVKGFGGGGLDDRFDFILVSEEIMNTGSRVRYAEGSYVAFGNNGQLLNKKINDPSNDSLPLELLDALFAASDHLPVIMKLVIE